MPIFRTRAEAIAHSRKHTPRYHVPFPDLSCAKPGLSDPTCGFGPTPARKANSGTPAGFIVATTHKQGPAVHSIKELPYVGGRKL